MKILQSRAISGFQLTIQCLSWTCAGNHCEINRDTSRGHCLPKQGGEAHHQSNRQGRDALLMLGFIDFSRKQKWWWRGTLRAFMYMKRVLQRRGVHASGLRRKYGNAVVRWSPARCSKIWWNGEEKLAGKVEMCATFWRTQCFMSWHQECNLDLPSNWRQHARSSETVAHAFQQPTRLKRPTFLLGLKMFWSKMKKKKKKHYAELVHDTFFSILVCIPKWLPLLKIMSASYWATRWR